MNIWCAPSPQNVNSLRSRIISLDDVANPDGCQEGQTPLHIAAAASGDIQSKLDIIEVLLHYGGYIEAVDKVNN